MPCCLALRAGIAGVAFVLAVALATPQPTRAQSPAPTPAPTPPAASEPAAPPTTPAQPGDAFGENTALAAKTIVYVKGTGSWDKAFQTISASLQKIKTYLDKEGIKPDGMPMTIFTATDDTGFDYQAAIPIAEAPKNAPRGDIAVGQSPAGQALKFVHRGSYDDLDNTYEAITNYLDDNRLEAKDMFIEEYVTDPLGADASKLVVNVYVLIKPPGTSPG
ncbi:MAG TPA: GyrI-like domain-containing protein [Xanthobacteraceae bacterium]|nr:GyrI-like domain-containing protein [Xanthobacteraceae bacterium]